MIKSIKDEEENYAARVTTDNDYWEKVDKMMKFIKDDEASYEVIVATGDDWEVAGNLVKDENGMWNFEYGNQSVEYEDSLRETEVDLEEEFENGKEDYLSHYFGNYKYNK